MRKQTILDEVEKYLESHEISRERENRYKAIEAILRRKYFIPENIKGDLIKLIIVEGSSYNRNFNRAQQLNKNLRGKDYYKLKKILEQKAQIDLGYTSGYLKDIKKLKTL